MLYPIELQAQVGFTEPQLLRFSCIVEIRYDFSTSVSTVFSSESLNGKMLRVSVELTMDWWLGNFAAIFQLTRHNSILTNK
jgi:hypothetical protein